MINLEIKKLVTRYIIRCSGTCNRLNTGVSNGENSHCRHIFLIGQIFVSILSVFILVDLDQAMTEHRAFGPGCFIST